MRDLLSASERVDLRMLGQWYDRALRVSLGGFEIGFQHRSASICECFESGLRVSLGGFEIGFQHRSASISECFESGLRVL